MGASSVYKMPVYIVHKVPEIEKECFKHSFISRLKLWTDFINIIHFFWINVNVNTNY